MRKTLLLFSAISISLLAQSHAPAILNNQRIYDLVTTGVSTDEVLRIVATAPKIDFDLRPISTDALLKTGVSEDVIKAMAARENGQPISSVDPKVEKFETIAAVTPPAVAIPSVVVSVPVPAPAEKGEARARIFVDEMSEWQAGSLEDARSSSYTGASAMSHARLIKLTISLMKQLDQHCPGVLIVNRPENADLFVRLDQSKGMWARHDDMAVFNRAGEMMFAASTHSILKDAKRFCSSMAVR